MTLEKTLSGVTMNKRFPAYLIIIVIAVSAVAIVAAARLRQGVREPRNAAAPLSTNQADASSTHQATAAIRDVVGDQSWQFRRPTPEHAR
jgi:hypothetical protein